MEIPVLLYLLVKKYLFFASIGLTLLLLVSVGIIYPKTTSPKDRLPTPSSAILPYNAEWNLRQSLNACGPYSAAAVIRILTQSPISSEAIAQATPWRYRGYTLPFGVVSILQSHHLLTEEAIVAGTDEEKISWLQAQLAQQKPVILLGRKNGLLHYVTLVGYQPDQFHVYDSLEEKGVAGMTLDKNGLSPGNTNWTTGELLTFWSQGGLFGLYQQYAIVIAPK